MSSLEDRGRNIATQFSPQMEFLLAKSCQERHAIARRHPGFDLEKLADYEKQQLWIDGTQAEINMAVATLFSTEMAQLTANAGGATQVLPQSVVAGGRQRTFVANLALAAQASGTTFGMARIPLYAAIVGITIITDTSLGTTTIALGDANTANLYLAAQTFTSVNTPTKVGNALTHGQPITSGYDSVTGNLVTPFMPQTAGQGGFNYEDITMVTAVAALPATGNLVILFEYSID
ncbi:MAG TPA: hypothetical protein VGR70_20865 [Stellaceae bacterium]|nr:hypothetical protein [Stellaceae bacterium]